MTVTKRIPPMNTSLLQESKALMPGRARAHWSPRAELTEGPDEIKVAHKNLRELEKKYKEMRNLAQELKRAVMDLSEVTAGKHSFDAWDPIEGSSKDIAYIARKIRDLSKKARSNVDAIKM